MPQSTPRGVSFYIFPNAPALCQAFLEAHRISDSNRFISENISFGDVETIGKLFAFPDDSINDDGVQTIDSCIIRVAA
jgi:hypothetical protein